jgi:hypothetical protein
MEPWLFGMLGTGNEATTDVATINLATADRSRER